MRRSRRRGGWRGVREGREGEGEEGRGRSAQVSSMYVCT